MKTLQFLRSFCIGLSITSIIKYMLLKAEEVRAGYFALLSFVIAATSFNSKGKAGSGMPP